MANPDLEISLADIHEFQRRIRESQANFAETVAMTRKSIDESMTLIAKVNAILAKR